MHRFISILLSAAILTSIASLMTAEHLTFLQNFNRFFFKILIMVVVLEILAVIVLRLSRWNNDRHFFAIVTYAVMGALTFCIVPAIKFDPYIKFDIHLFFLLSLASYWASLGAIVHYLIQLGVKYILPRIK